MQCVSSLQKHKQRPWGKGEHGSVEELQMCSVWLECTVPGVKDGKDQLERVAASRLRRAL